MRAAILMLTAVALAAGARAADKGYAHPELLVDPAWVATHGGDADVRVVDMRDAATYAAGHIPGAVRLDDAPLRNREDKDTYLPTPASMGELMGRLGISNNTHVVIYDETAGPPAARLWYVLNAYGHDSVSLLNGGWKRWAAENRPVSKDTPEIKTATFTPRLTPTLTCPSPQVLARKPGVVVLDTRSAGEYKGARIPGAVNVEWKQNLTPDGTFRPADELRKLYADHGLTPDKEIVSHCASGGRAAQTLFTLKLLGYPKVRVYYGSFSDYTSRPDAPVEK